MDTSPGGQDEMERRIKEAYARFREELARIERERDRTIEEILRAIDSRRIEKIVSDLKNGN